MKNFAVLAERFIDCDAAVVAKDRAALVKIWTEGNRQDWKLQGERARKTLDSLRGATEKSVDEIEALIDQ